MAIGFNGITGYNAISGFSGFSGFNGFSGIGFSPFPPPPPVEPNAIHDYYFANPNLSLATVERVRGINHANDFNETDRNILQDSSGSIVTYPAGTVAFNQGVGAVVEPEGVNIMTYSAEIDNAIWTKTGATVSANQVTAPDGTLTADKLVEDTSTGVHRIFQLADGLPISEPYVMSCFVKAAERTRVEFFESNGVLATYDLANGTVVSGSGTITALADGWYFITNPTPTQVDGDFVAQLRLDNGVSGIYTGDGVSGVYAWGLQVESGSTATSYIETLAAAAQRDASQLKASNFTERERWYDDGSGGVPCVISDSNAFGAIDGVAPTTIRWEMNTVAGKYLNQFGTSLVDGAIGRAWNGVVFELTANSVQSTFWTMIHNPTGLSDESALREGIGNDGTSSNPFTIDFTTSGYINNSDTLAADTLVVDAFRTSAGDDVSGMPAAAMTQANNIEYVLDFVYGAFNTDAVKSICLLEQADAMNYIGIGNDSVNNDTIWVERSIAGAVDNIDVMFSTDFVEGDEVTARLTVTPSLVTLSVTNNTTQEMQTSTNNTTLLGDIIHPDSVLLGDTGGGVARAFVHTNARLQILDVS